MREVALFTKAFDIGMVNMPQTYSLKDARSPAAPGRRARAVVSMPGLDAPWRQVLKVACSRRPTRHWHPSRVGSVGYIRDSGQPWERVAAP